ncbi:Crp/Fnr family transcriptional regulator [Otariodibacter sp.]|uniref:Crp/Fnr family transcriptional regulator n=1 Tax=Otariodibacter sp. TaxID=3030919 RepID=UPI00262B1B8B|nr:Crp/Fnr family transcriptional regulator [Otariodibacter sp.]
MERHINPITLNACKLIPFHTLSKGMIIYEQGETAQEFYFIHKGLIGLYHTLDNGKESLVRLYKENEYFGYRTLFGDSQYHCSAKVLVDAEITRIKPTSVNRFFFENPKVSKRLLQTLANELREAEQRLAKSSYLKTSDRVIQSIDFLTKNYPYYNWTYREIGEFAGCETETAIRITNELKRKSALPLSFTLSKSK